MVAWALARRERGEEDGELGVLVPGAPRSSKSTLMYD